MKKSNPNNLMEMVKDALLLNYKRGFMAGARIAVETQHNLKDGEDIIQVFVKKMDEAVKEETMTVKLVDSLLETKFGKKGVN